MKNSTILITVKGGLISEIFSTDSNVNIIVQDWDNLIDFEDHEDNDFKDTRVPDKILSNGEMGMLIDSNFRKAEKEIDKRLEP